MDSIWATIQQEFSDVPDLNEATIICVRLMVAALLGSLIGLDRERKGKAAGLRTHMMVSLGAALFILVPLRSGMEVADASRVLQGIIAGIGFLGAGAILKQDSHGAIKGLTTASSVWVAAAVGIAAGMGRETTAVLGTLAALFILGAMARLERRIDPTVPSAAAGQSDADGARTASPRYIPPPEERDRSEPWQIPR